VSKTKELKKRLWGQERIITSDFGSRLPCERLSFQRLDLELRRLGSWTQHDWYRYTHHGVAREAFAVVLHLDEPAVLVKASTWPSTHTELASHSASCALSTSSAIAANGHECDVAAECSMRGCTLLCASAFIVARSESPPPPPAAAAPSSMTLTFAASMRAACAAACALLTVFVRPAASAASAASAVAGEVLARGTNVESAALMAEGHAANDIFGVAAPATEHTRPLLSVSRPFANLPHLAQEAAP